MSGLTIFVIVIAVLAVVMIATGVRAVPQGTEYTVERFGRFIGLLRPGFHVIVPFVDRVGAKINMKETVLDVPEQEVITKDNAMITANGVVFYQIVEAAKAAYEVTNLKRGILNLAMTNLRTVMGSMDLDPVETQPRGIVDHILDGVFFLTEMPVRVGGHAQANTRRRGDGGVSRRSDGRAC